MVHLTGWKYGAFVGTIVGMIGVTLYPVVIYPMFNPDAYKVTQSTNRANIKQEDIQPGGMKVWTDPFKPSDR